MARPKLEDSPHNLKYPKAGETWRHNGNEVVYTVMGVARDATNGRGADFFVIYASPEGALYVRTLAEFMGFLGNGKTMRFEPIKARPAWPIIEDVPEPKKRRKYRRRKIVAKPVVVKRARKKPGRKAKAA